MICSERYFQRGDDWHSVACTRPATVMVYVLPFSKKARWEPKCGVHGKRYEQTRPVPS